MAIYDYPINGLYNETVATLDDGRVVTINTQYAVVLPHGKHADNCDQINKMGGRCNCGLLDGIDVEALVADARINGKRGERPVERKPEAPVKIDSSRLDKQLCPKCQTVCYGDCEAN